MLISFS